MVALFIGIGFWQLQKNQENQKKSTAQELLRNILTIELPKRLFRIL